MNTYKGGFSGMMLCVVILFSQNAFATDMSLEVGPGLNQAAAIRVGLSFPSKWKAFDNVSIATEMGLLVTKGGGIVDVTPIFSYGSKWFVEGGIGLSLASSARLDNRNESSTLNFRDVLGVGYHFNKWTLGVRMEHYSNGGSSLNPLFGTHNNAGYTWTTLNVVRPF